MKRMDLRMSWHCKLPRILPHVILANAIIPRKCNKIDGCTHTQSISKHTSPNKRTDELEENREKNTKLQLVAGVVFPKPLADALLRDYYEIDEPWCTAITAHNFVYLGLCIHAFRIDPCHTRTRTQDACPTRPDIGLNDGTGQRATISGQPTPKSFSIIA